MRVLKAINNNVVSCVDDSGRELIAMGKGLGFRSRAGDILRPEDAEKVFRMESDEEFSRFKDVLSQLPVRLLELCSRIIDHADHVLGRQLSESIYLTLTDHVNFALERVHRGIQLHNALVTEMRVFYPGEFAVGQYALEQIAAQEGVQLPEDEAASIAMHLVNAQYNSSINTTMHVVQVLQPMIDIIEGWPGLCLNKNHLYYNQLIVDLKFIAMQAFSQTPSGWGSSELEDVVKKLYPEAYACAEATAGYLSRQSGRQIPREEQAHLAICIRRACIS